MKNWCDKIATSIPVNRTAAHMEWSSEPPPLQVSHDRMVNLKYQTRPIQAIRRGKFMRAIRRGKQPPDGILNLMTCGEVIPGVTVMAYYGQIYRDGHTRSAWVVQCNSCGYLWASNTSWLLHKDSTCYSCNRMRVA